jgi:hypothetical protein
VVDAGARKAGAVAVPGAAVFIVMIDVLIED